MLSLYSCSSELRKAFPISQYERQQFLDLVSTANLIPEQHSVYRDHAQQLETISKPCQLYITMGCSFVLNLKIVGESSSSWTRYLNASAGRITKNYVSPVNKTMNFISHYTGIIPLIWFFCIFVDNSDFSCPRRNAISTMLDPWPYNFSRALYKCQYDRAFKIQKENYPDEERKQSI
jgi:hypothetical protein